MDPRIKNLKSTTFQGTRFTRCKLADMQEKVQTFPGLSHHELAQTRGLHHRWQTPKGRNRLGFALRLLQDPERLGIVSLPARHGPGRGHRIPLTYELDESSCVGTGSPWFQQDATPLTCFPRALDFPGTACQVQDG